MAKTAFERRASFQAPKDQLDRLRHALESGAAVIVEQPNGERITSRELSHFLATTVSEIASGDEVVLLRGKSELSPAEAGELLGISRQFVDRLIDTGQLVARRLPGSRHRRLRVADIVTFAKERDNRQRLISDAVNALVDTGADY